MSASKEHPVVWWIGWIVLTIVAFFIPCYAWTKFFAMHVGTMDKPGMPALWVTAVFGTWMLFLVPLIIVMYNKVDRAYEDARNARERQAKELLASRFPVKALTVDGQRLLLPKPLQKKLKRLPKTLKKGQLVSLEFKDGRKLENVFVYGNEEIVGVYGRRDFPFDAREAVKADLLDPAQAPPVDYDKWLRLQAE